MQTASAAFGTGIIAPDQMIGYTVTITLPSGVQASFGDLSDCTESVTFYRQETTTLPDGTTLIAGYSTVQPIITLSGLLNQGAGVVGIEGQTAYWLFNPNDTTSPMYRKTRLALPVTISMGLYDGSSTPELLAQFTGTIDQIVCADGLVTLTCRDNRSTITNQAYLPPIITPDPYNAGLTSAYAVDYLARHASPAQYYSWPKQRTGCLLAASLRSSIWPEVGSLASRFGQPTPVFQSGVYGPALSFQINPIIYQLAGSLQTTDHNCASLLAATDPTHGFNLSFADAANLYTFTLSLNLVTNSLLIFTNTPSGTSSLNTVTSVPAGFNHLIEISFTWAASSTTVAGTVWVDGTSHAFSMTALNARPSGTNFTLVSANGVMEGLQVTNEASFATGAPFTPTLVLDQSLNPVTALPDVSGQDSWSVLQDIAQAEAAVVGFDELGVLHFRNRTTIRSSTVARTVTSTTSLITADSSEQMSLAATHVQIPVSAVVIQNAGTVWNSSTPIGLPSHGSVTIHITTDNIVVAVTPTDSGYYPDSGSVPGLSYWRGALQEDGSGAVTTGVSFTVAQLSATSLAVTITNSNWFEMWLVSPTATGTVTPESTETLTIGAPLLIIGGQSVTAAQAVIADEQWPSADNGGAISNTIFGEILLQVTSNSWLQDANTAQDLATSLLSDLHYPKPQYLDVAIVPDPRLQLLDRITLIDSDVSQVNSDMLIIGISTIITRDTWSQALDLRSFFRPGAWILGKAGSSELGLTTFIY